ncbi:TIGR00366 family protein [Paracidovorax citrulli]|uniref:Short chain fatty acid transporter n=2 Tax=Paracidovorax citrulli TaxID=80869 RepID=A1TU44_PARC0|nr:TIGR00366 family protein [Paracidovorax citrulli]ABM34482.1 short chain fatty acid transporter [Paracidovorax citrulli AAC00-1]ATG93945.1 short-chain fatty acid transporter [Paracidovorax citrulli]MVT28039.1 short-chain fatty acid transporter [Paracidovorax citrulli]MVT37248.1 short-chain fatty acid transporter [Paracidovorax citrulli]PVY63923.1 short-chain fatty acids transporter [Paracidovorax citrulli]
MSKITAFFTELMRRYLPDPFVFAILLTLLTMALAFGVESRPIDAVVQDWGKGFWSLLAFTTQMAVILVMGYVLAAAPIVDRFLDRIAARVSTPRQAIIVATLVGGVGSYLNWGFGLVIGGIMARKLALKVKGVHYPLIIAAAYTGFTMYSLGFSATIPVLISTKGHAFEGTMGLIPLTQTIFSAPILLTSLAVLVALPLLNAAMHPRQGEKVVELDPATVAEARPAASAEGLLGDEKTLAWRLNNSRMLSLLIGLCGMAYVVMHFVRGGNLDLNMINFFILFLGVLLLGTPMKYVEKVNEGVKTIGGIILQFPFYAGIMAIMHGSGLVESIAHVFVNISTAATLPLWGLVSSFVINFFAPSGGGHWVLQGPFMINAATTLGASQAQTAMSVMLGNGWNDLVQPFWILPALALSKLKLKDIMGYTVVSMLLVGAIYAVTMLVWPDL